MIYLVIFIAFLALISIILILKVKIIIEYSRKGFDDHLILSLFMLKGLIKIKYEVPLIDLQKNGIRFKKIKEKGKKEKDEKKDKAKFNFNEIIEKIKSIHDYYKDNKDIICKTKVYLKRKLKIEEISLNVDFGTGDSFYTGIISGILWALSGTLVSAFTNIATISKSNVNIKSDFSEKKFNIDLFCIFSIRVVHIIVISLIMLIHKKSKNKKIKHMIGGGLNA